VSEPCTLNTDESLVTKTFENKNCIIIVSSNHNMLTNWLKIWLFGLICSYICNQCLSPLMF